ncbi:MAG: hypothetical protein KGI84_09920, partial [Elusimicrobia bacterium]|nr:hypothetical protein [Elusimicrobiota bacterium]
MNNLLGNQESDWEEICPGELEKGGAGDGSGGEVGGGVGRSLTPKIIRLLEKISEYGYLTM